MSVSRSIVTAFVPLALALSVASSAHAGLPDLLDNVSFIGPRAGVSLVPKETRKDVDNSGLVNSLFGWTLDIRYPSKRNFEGYAEGGFFLEGVERGRVFPEAWGYFGFRQKQGFGLGLGPSFSLYGAGLGIAPAYYFRIDRIMIPVTFNTVISSGQPRYQLNVGFSYGSE